MIFASKLTSKFQASIPKKIRAKLNLQAGDMVEFEEKNDEVVIKKVKSATDKSFLKLQEKNLQEWNSDIDNTQFDYLKNLIK
jgi:AbrB family looped-hinge helix DNA binding protein